MDVRLDQPHDSALSDNTRQKNARACVVAESRAYHDASNVVDAAEYAFEPQEL